MTGGGPAVEKLRDYLRTLAPGARALLVAELERASLRGEQAPGGELILEELRRTIREYGQPVPRIGDAARLFFLPLEPFLIDGPADHKRLGRLARVSLDPIWEWIGRDLLPAEVKTLGEDVNRALSENDRTKAEQLMRALHDRAHQRIKDTIASVNRDDRARRRLAVQVGTPRALEDLEILAAVLAQRDVLSDLARRLPNHLRSFEREQIESVKTMLEGAAAQKPSAAAVAKADLFLYGFILVMSRLSAPWQLIRIATYAAESDAAGRIAETPFAIAVTIVIGELECMVGDLRAELKLHRPVIGLLKAIHDTVRGLRTEIDLSGDSPWSRRLTAIRTEVSNLLKAEIETTPGRVRRLLRPRSAKEVVAGSLLDATDVREVETLVEFVGACRNHANELAVNEATMRSYSELQLYLESGAKVLLDGLRHAGDADRPFRQSQVDAAIRFCRVVFGADYAGLLAKASEIAVQTANAERKSARA
jgi:ribosomal protein S20